MISLTRKKRSDAGRPRKADRTIPQQIGSLYDALTPAERALSRELLDFIDLRPVARKAEASLTEHLKTDANGYVSMAYVPSTGEITYRAPEE